MRGVAGSGRSVLRTGGKWEVGLKNWMEVGLRTGWSFEVGLKNWMEVGGRS